jgi:hypothetical protein
MFLALGTLVATFSIILTIILLTSREEKDKP